MPHLKKLFSYTSLLLFLLFLTSCNTQMTILTDVDERSANEIVVFLASRGIVAEKTPAATAQAAGAGGTAVAPMWNIVVEAQQATEAMALLNRNGLPRAASQTLLNLFGETGLVPTDMQDQIRFQAGLSEQIAGTIRKIDGVIDADVQISFPAPDSPSPITASVYVKHQGILDNPNSQLVNKIKQLVSGSVSGLTLENVTVISDRSRFTDISFTDVGEDVFDESREYVEMWSVVIAKNSVAAFQGIFFTFLLLIFALVALLVWLLWKFFPLVKSIEGGWGSLIRLGPLVLKKPQEAIEPLPDEQ